MIYFLTTEQYMPGRSEKPFLGLLIFARPVFGGAARRCSVVV